MAFRGYQRRSAEDVEKRAAQQGGDYKGFIKDEYKTWTPKKGDNWVRFLPPTWDNPVHYALEVFAHYQVGPEKASVICNLKQHSTRCAMCEARITAEHSNASEEELREYKWSKRVVAWILDMKEPDKGPQIWVMPWTIDRDVNKICKDRRSGETYFIDDPDNGYDVFFDREGDGIGTKYAGFQLARKPSSVSDRDLDYIQDHPLTEVFMERSYAEVMSLYTGGADDEPTPRGRQAPERGARDEPTRREPERRDTREREPERRDSRDDRGRDEPRGRDSRDDRDRDPPPRHEREPERRDTREPEPELPQRRGSSRRSIEQDPPFEPDPPRDRPRDAVDDDRIPEDRWERERTTRDSRDDRDRDPPPRREEARRDERDAPQPEERRESGGSRAAGLRERINADRAARR